MFSGKKYKRHELVKELIKQKNQLSKNGLRLLKLNFEIKGDRFVGLSGDEIISAISLTKRLIRNRV